MAMAAKLVGRSSLSGLQRQHSAPISPALVPVKVRTCCAVKAPSLVAANTRLDVYLQENAPESPARHSTVEKLLEGGFITISDLNDVSLRNLVEMGIPSKIRVYLEDFVKPSDLNRDVADKMTLYFTWENVTLKPENYIEQLPPQYNPEYLGSLEPDSEADSGNSDTPTETNPFTLRLLDFGDSPALRSVWGKDGKAQAVLERKCYRILWRRLMSIRGRKAILLLGVPGVGKTGFLLYVLARLMEHNKIVFFRCKGGQCFLYEPSTYGYRCTLESDYTALMDRRVYFLADGKLPDVPLFFGRAILTSTPYQDNYKEFDKDGAGRRYYVPVWSAAEIALAYQEIFSKAEEFQSSDVDDLVDFDRDIDESDEAVSDEEKEQTLTLDVVKDRYRKWGGTARYVLERTEEDIDKVVRDIESIQTTVQAVGKKLAGGEHPSHKLVHMQVEANRYRNYDYMFASPYILDLAYQKLQRSEEGALRAFVRFRGLAAHGLDALKGGILQMVFKNMARGHQVFKIRRLHQTLEDEKNELDTSISFNFGTPLENFYSLKTLTIPEDEDRYRIYWPSLPVQATFDAFLVRKTKAGDSLDVFQATMSSGRNGHGLKYRALLDLMEKFQVPGARTRVFVVTTSELFPDAGYQSWRTGARVAGKSEVLQDQRILKKLLDVEQYALDCSL